MTIHIWYNELHKIECLTIDVDQKYGMTTVDLNNLAYMDEPFVLANDKGEVVLQFTVAS